MDALFVDLPNFYSHFLESGIEEPRLLRNYFLYWFDFDRLAKELTNNFSSVWVFHSGRRFGRKPNRIEGEYLNNFINRINSLKGVTAWDVDIPSQQREPVSYECENCGHTGSAQWESEKGIDASLTVHLFDTMESWDSAILLSGDADFVPAVSSLRRRGKIVVGAGFSGASSALIRECYDYINLSEFLREDVAAYQIFRKEGLIDQWFHSDVVSLSEPHPDTPIYLSVNWLREDRLRFIDAIKYQVSLKARGPINLTERHKSIEEFDVKYPKIVERMNSPAGEYLITLSSKVTRGIDRRIKALSNALEDTYPFKDNDWNGYRLTYLYNTGDNQFRASRV